MDDLHARLRRLRREAERSEPAAPPPAAELPGWLERRLARGAAASTNELSLDPPAELVDQGSSEACFQARLRRFGTDHRHGHWSLAELRSAEREALALLARDERLREVDLERALFLDTETTGLSGGAGTYVFLVGLGRCTAEGFELWQGFLRGPEEEAALLEEVARRIRAAGCIVSFFGKSFDRHRLEDKMRLHRIAAPFADCVHLDLYHPCRRLTQGWLPDGRLRTVEAALAGVERGDDLPGSLAPAAWFDWLAGRPHRLEGVFRHNQEDVLSLVVLTAHLGRVLAERRADGSELGGSSTRRAHALYRSWRERGEREIARACLERAHSLAQTEGHDPRPLALELAELHLRARRRDAAAELLAELLLEPPDRIALEAALLLVRLHGQRGELARAEVLLERTREAIERTTSGRVRARLERAAHADGERLARRRRRA